MVIGEVVAEMERVERMRMVELIVVLGGGGDV